MTNLLLFFYILERKLVYFLVPLKNLFLRKIIPTKSSDFSFNVNKTPQFNIISLSFPASRTWLRVKDKINVILNKMYRLRSSRNTYISLIVDSIISVVQIESDIYHLREKIEDLRFFFNVYKGWGMFLHQPLPHGLLKRL